ncbi:MAG: mercury(II) reductase [Thermoproteota archaeon]|jgi:mercuric reductase
MVIREYDLAIVGYGAAGFASAIKYSELTEGNSKVALIGKGPLGGTCVNVGCIPSKYLLEASHKVFYSKFGKYKGIEGSEAKVNFFNLMEGLNEFILNLRKSKYEDVIESYDNVELIEGEAKFVSDSQLVVNSKNGQIKISAKNFIVSVGSRPSIPPIEGINETGYLTSDTIWNIRDLPSRIGIIGGGAIGVEIGQAFLHLGADVTIIEALPRIAYTSEPEISKLLEEILKEEGIKIFTRVRVAKAYKKNKEKVLKVLSHDKELELNFDEIIVATGRRPNTDNLNLENVNVRTNSRGQIITDDKMQTSNPKIYAAGDCVDKKLMLETLAAKEGTVAAMNIAGQESKMDYLSIPWAIFTNPSVASVGYLESEAVEKFKVCSCRVIELSDIPKGLIIQERKGLIKLVIDPNSGKILGVHSLSPYSVEFIIEGALAVKYGLTIWDIIDSVHIFPTISEGIKIASQSFIRNIERMSCCVE